MHMRLGSAPEQLLCTADYSLNDAFDDKSLHADSAAHYSARRAWGFEPSGRWRDSTRQSEGNAMGYRCGMRIPLLAPVARGHRPAAAGFGPLELLARHSCCYLIIICDNRSIKQSCSLY